MPLYLIFSAYTFFYTIKKNQLNLTIHAIFSKNNYNDNYLRHLTNHGKVLTNNLTLTVAENDRLMTDGKGHYNPPIVGRAEKDVFKM